ncbi:hypothetical protein AKJ64_05205 [candidate division MSBL1 archaeon SCGC-AAA259E17]|uniref:Major facilitator superfamily (MFS) profile domain-containing protein n=1 Tax=candidate division MSBL1 archaeon SCGC-AAA259E17 TaxID=1698263 RepID=A0A133U9F1_9EURY|nr:hypothetical protein AKJ64_05205 [candidate division MSBL1 archaeon SCGC-AAA259E17]
MLLWTAAFLTAKLAPNVALLGLAVVLYGAGQGMALPTAMVWVGDVVSERFYGRFSSYLGTFGYLGQFAAPVVYAPVLAHLGIGNLFLAASGASAALFVVALAASRLP